MQMRYFLGTLTENFSGIGMDSFVFKREFFILQPLRCFLASLSYLYFLVPCVHRITLFYIEHGGDVTEPYYLKTSHFRGNCTRMTCTHIHAHTRARLCTQARTHARTHIHTEWTLCLCFILQAGLYNFFSDVVCASKG